MTLSEETGLSRVGRFAPCLMTERSPFRYFKTSPDIIRLAVMIYVRFPLSLRNVGDLLHERGIEICHETVRKDIMVYTFPLVATQRWGGCRSPQTASQCCDVESTSQREGIHGRMSNSPGARRASPATSLSAGPAARGPSPPTAGMPRRCRWQRRPRPTKWRSSTSLSSGAR
jgi:hypothetical protein